MKNSSRLIAGVHRQLTALYPPGFRLEFCLEMQFVFKAALEDAAARGWLPLVSLCYHEVKDFPGAWWNAYLNERKAYPMSTISVDPHPLEEKTTPSSKVEAFMGALPFLLFGLVSLITKLPNLPISSVVLFLAFDLLCLVGLAIGWIKGWASWTFAYLGWILVFAWWFSDISTPGFRFLGHTFSYREPWGWRMWLPVAVIALIALLWTRSLQPLKNMVYKVWRDWTHLSLMAYPFLAWMLLIYDENHHPFLLVFMLASTLVISAGAWGFLRLPSLAWRMAALVIGANIGVILAFICDYTWDYWAYNHLPKLVEPWYQVFNQMRFFLVIWLPLLFFPILIPLFRSLTRRKASQ